MTSAEPVAYEGGCTGIEAVLAPGRHSSVVPSSRPAPLQNAITMIPNISAELKQFAYWVEWYPTRGNV